MATEYGYRYSAEGVENWCPGWDQDAIRDLCADEGATMIARDVSPTRIVSIRA